MQTAFNDIKYITSEIESRDSLTHLFEKLSESPGLLQRIDMAIAENEGQLKLLVKSPSLLNRMIGYMTPNCPDLQAGHVINNDGFKEYQSFIGKYGYRVEVAAVEGSKNIKSYEKLKIAGLLTVPLAGMFASATHPVAGLVAGAAALAVPEIKGLSKMSHAKITLQHKIKM